MKTVRKLKDIGIHNIGEQESWLQDMALKGLFIQKAGPFFCRFRKGEPMPMKYRLVPVADMPMTPKMKKESAQNGWDFVTNYGIFFLYSSPVSSNAPEWDLPPADYAKKLKRLSDRAFVIALALVAYLSILILGLYTSYTYPYTPYSDMLGAELVAQGLFIVFGIGLLINALFKLITVNALKKSLSSGNPIHHNLSWRKKRKQNRLKAGIFCALFIFVLAFPFTQNTVQDAQRIPLPMNTDALPIVRLATIETSPDLIRYQGEANDEEAYSYARVSSLLAPVQISSYERGTLSTESNPFVDNTVYKLAFACMANKVLREWMDFDNEIMAALYFDEDVQLVELDNPDFDTLWLVTRKRGFLLYAGKERVVIRISYFGAVPQDMDTVIQAVADNITQLSR